ncbi:predicted protein [Sclerotinia sclerotiorum 1980 UF-70]|uniref:Uncharacterized protein n=1 Tax=Sclerotinia sclerotiorum (strain ATCC 18683 / 1980 / Ss-1) TaxID=665079 RepID=A7E8P2_SCLS1|nr:predicted protein [Sclerotinia sclerotiorum 1980 UF-70]EDN96744.1 predicted protein [Sclerotinia sclerotiorum 1980 UF-70]
MSVLGTYRQTHQDLNSKLEYQHADIPVSYKEGTFHPQRCCTLKKEVLSLKEYLLMQTTRQIDQHANCASATLSTKPGSASFKNGVNIC